MFKLVTSSMRVNDYLTLFLYSSREEEERKIIEEDEEGCEPCLEFDPLESLDQYSLDRCSIPDVQL